MTRKINDPFLITLYAYCEKILDSSVPGYHADLKARYRVLMKRPTFAKLVKAKRYKEALKVFYSCLGATVEMLEAAQ